MYAEAHKYEWDICMLANLNEANMTTKYKKYINVKTTNKGVYIIKEVKLWEQSIEEA